MTILQNDPAGLFGPGLRPLFLAPMAGITGSAFRRLVADFGGYDALFTEMLHGRMLLNRDVARSPYTKKRGTEGRVVYQLLLTGDEDIPRIVGALRPLAPFGIDLNAACPAPAVKKFRSGFELYSDLPKFARTVATLRKEWDGPLSVKFRMGEDGDWQEHFLKALKILEENGVDFLTFHPRFKDEKLKRPALWKHLPWVVSSTKLPVVLSGDITSPKVVADNPGTVGLASGLMLGRIAIVRPWVFREFRGESVTVDYAEVWNRYRAYVVEDFQPVDAYKRMREFSVYYGRNFFYGHDFYTRVWSAPDLEVMTARAMEFLADAPRVVLEPSLSGI